MDIDHRANRGEFKQPACVIGPQVDATMAHRRPEIMVPIGAMQSIILVEVHHVRHSWQVITWSRHRCGTIFDINFICSSDRWVVPGTGRDQEVVEFLIALVYINTLQA